MVKNNCVCVFVCALCVNVCMCVSVLVCMCVRVCALTFKVHEEMP